MCVVPWSIQKVERLQKASEAKDLKAIVQLMRDTLSDADFQEDCCSVLVALTPSHDLEVFQRMIETEDKLALQKLTDDCKAVVDAGVVNVLLESARTHPDDPDIQELMCRILFHLARTDDDSVNRALSSTVDQV